MMSDFKFHKMVEWADELKIELSSSSSTLVNVTAADMDGLADSLIALGVMMKAIAETDRDINAAITLLTRRNHPSNPS